MSLSTQIMPTLSVSGDKRVPLTEEEDLWSLYRAMFQIRCVEESFLRLYNRGLIYGTVHTCIGQEVCAVAVTRALDPQRDVLWTGHRGHGHYLAFTGDLSGLISELLGKASGVCAGIGGSQHLHRANFYSNGVLGGTVPCAVGCAFAEKAKGNDSVVAVFFGDGAMAEGAIYESLNLAALWKLPVLFVLEDNGIAQSTPRDYEHAGDLATRARSFGIEATKLCASDVVDVCAACRTIVDRVRRLSEPHFLILETTRLASHSKGDDTRDAEEIAALRARDPLRHSREMLSACDPDRLDALEAAVNREIEVCISTATEEGGLLPSEFLKRSEA
jgi:TPP-dependent pyruvate/acetoin dehydrogenase alpha subunit